MAINFTFEESHFNRIFPFYFIINQQMVIEANGTTLEKLFAGVKGKNFEDCFVIKRPQLNQFNFQSLKTLANQLLVIECFNTKHTILRGQIDYLPQTNQLLFLGSPWFDSIEEVIENKLSLHDFAFHDSMTDLLHVMKTQENTNDDLKQLLKTVNHQSDELKNANKQIHDIALFPTQNPDPLMRINFAGDLLQNNPAAAQLDFVEFENKLFRNDEFFKIISERIDKNEKRWTIEASSENRDYSFACIIMKDEGYINIYGRDITQQKNNEKELEATASRLSSLISNLHAGILLENEEHSVVLVNSQFCNMFKIAEEPTSLTGADCAHLAQQTKYFFKNQNSFLARVDEVLTERKLVVDDRLELIDGRFIERAFIPIWNENNFDGNLWVFTDITDKINADKKLEEQRVFYEEILDNIPSDIAVFDDQHRYLYLNPRAVKDQKIRKWMIGKTDEDYIRFRKKPEAILEARSSVFKNILKSKQLVSWEEEMEQPDGLKQVILRNMYPVLNNDNAIKLVIGYGVDITQIKKIQHQIEQSEKKYRDVIENGMAVVTTHDLDGIFLSVNPMVGKIYGYHDEEMIGQSLTKFMPAEDKSLFQVQYLDKIKQDKQASGIFRVLHKDGKIIYSLYNNFLKEEPGEQPYVIGFAVDITDRVEAEKQLKIAKKVTEEMAQTKQNFLANMSHEIRTPMNAIMGMTNQLFKTPLNTDQQFYLNIIHSASDNLLIIINDILDLSKIEAGKLTIEKIGFEPQAVVGRAMQVMMHRAQEKGLNFTNSFCDTRLSPVLLGDPYRLNQILLNLISNAVKFTTKGTIDITCKVVEDNEDKQTIEAAVTDTGIGMDESFAKNLFEKFSQEDDSTTRKYGGTGLGMSICKELVSLMGGEIKVSSKKGVGTSMSFVIELQKGTTKDLPVKEITQTDTTLLTGKKILVTDDNEMNQLVAATMLQNYGAEITEAFNGQEAIDKIKGNHFDIVLMDVQMPVMDGLEATKIIRATISKDLPIVALTAFAIKGDNDKCIDAGMNDYLTKPFEESQLLSIVSKWLGKAIPTKIEIVGDAIITKEPLYDLSKLHEIARGNVAFINKMVNLFIEQIPPAVKEIQEAYTKKNYEIIKKVAHRIKPSIDNMGIVSLKPVIREIELLALENPHSPKLNELIKQLDTTLIIIIKSLQH